jgi:hypothetical protein
MRKRKSKRLAQTVRQYPMPNGIGSGISSMSWKTPSALTVSDACLKAAQAHSEGATANASPWLPGGVGFSAEWHRNSG